MNNRSCVHALKRGVTVSIHKLSDQEVQKLADLFKVFGDPTRVRILSVLKNIELNVSEIAEAVSMSQSATSHQLRILKAHRLVKYRKEGKAVYYSLDDEHVHAIFAQGYEHIGHR